MFQPDNACLRFDNVGLDFMGLRQTDPAGYHFVPLANCPEGIISDELLAVEGNIRKNVDIQFVTKIDIDMAIMYGPGASQEVLPIAEGKADPLPLRGMLALGGYAHLPCTDVPDDRILFNTMIIGEPCSDKAALVLLGATQSATGMV